jgi:hypothetical protein
MDYKIFKELDRIAGGYDNSQVTLIDGLVFSQYQTIRKILFYLNSQYLSGSKDELGRDKPFYNIVNFRCNVAYRATDLDVKDIRVYAENADHYELSFILNKEFQNWAADNYFGQFLNEFAETRPKYGGVLVKKVKENGEIMLKVVSWKNVITDPVDIETGVIIEKHYMTPEELAEKKDVWNNVPDAMKLASKKRKNSYGGDKTNLTDNRIPVYEMHGIFAEECDPEIEEPEEYKYKRMMFIIAGEGAKKVLLWSEEEKEAPYRYLAWEKVDGRGLGRGVVESSFEAQRWVNDAVQNEQNVMNIAGKVLIQTDSKALGDNAITDYLNGQFMVTEDGKTVRKIDLTPSSLPQYQNLKDSWDVQLQRETNTFDVVTGEELPASQTLGATAIAARQASSYFDQKREESGIFVVKMIEDWILPHLIKKMNKAHILGGQFSMEELQKLDKAFSISRANKKTIQQVLAGKPVDMEQYQQFIQEGLDIQRELGDTRFLEIPDNFFKNWKIKTKVVITDENMNKRAEMDNLVQLFQFATPEVMQDPILSQKLYELIEKSGTMSPISLKDKQMATQQQAKIPNQQPQKETLSEQVVPQAQK